jgi:hypothetical protein
VAVLAVAGLVGTAAFAARQNPTTVTGISKSADEPTSPTAAIAAPVNYSTGFEAVEGFTARDATFVAPATRVAPVEPPFSGWIKFQPVPCIVGVTCWGVTTAPSNSLWEGHVDQVHAYAGAQHLRLSHDATTRTNQGNFGLGVDARMPPGNPPAQTPAPNTVSAEVAITATGMDYRFQPQSNSQGLLATSTLFFYGGGIYVLDDLCGTAPLFFAQTGVAWDTTGGYKNMTVAMQPCSNHITYSYGGQQLYPNCVARCTAGGIGNLCAANVDCDTLTGGPGDGVCSAPGLLCNGGLRDMLACTTAADCGTACVYAGSNLEQFLVFGDNYAGSSMDVDNVVLTTGLQSSDPPVCGDNYAAVACGEECDGTDNANCPGRCLADCTCDRRCTQAAPCPLVNGANPAELTSGGFYTYTSDTPFVSIDNCAGNYDSWISITDAGTSAPLGYNDDCNTGAYGAGADLSAACYDGTSPYTSASFRSCTCVTGGIGVNLLIQLGGFTASYPLPPVGSSTKLTVDKKIVCNTNWANGACCDTNSRVGGDPFGCTDDVAAAACVGPDKVFTLNKVCAGITCACIPECAGRVCGDDGCGGTCAPDDCNDNNVCTDDSCSADGLCVNANNTITCNDDLFCTVGDVCGGGSCNGTPNLCSDGVACTNDSCDEATDTCNHNANDGLCDDGLFCNGVETCDVSAGCLDHADPCDYDRDSCNEALDVCEPLPIPTVSEWGLAVLALLLLIGAKVYFGRRQVTA